MRALFHTSIWRYFAVAGTIGLIGSGCYAPPRRAPVYDAFAGSGGIGLRYDTFSGMPTTRPTSEEGKDIADWRARYDLATDNGQRTVLRDRIANRMIILIKHYHEGTTDDLYELTSSLESMFDLAGLTLGAVGATTGGSTDKAFYNAAAGLLTGFRSSLGKNVLAEQTKFALITQMAASRTEKEADLVDRLKNNSDKDYRLDKVLIDLYDFFQAGSLKSAVAELAQKAQESKKTADDKLDNARKPEKSTTNETAPSPRTSP